MKAPKVIAHTSVQGYTVYLQYPGNEQVYLGKMEVTEGTLYNNKSKKEYDVYRLNPVIKEMEYIRVMNKTEAMSYFKNKTII